MTEQKTMNKFKAIAAMVRDGVKVKWSDDNLIYFYDKELLCQKEGGPAWVEADLPEGGDYTIYQKPPKMKTWYKGYFKNSFGEIFEMGRWHDSLEKAKNYGYPFVTHEERQFPEVG